jgi:hypothetical protein
MKNYKEGNVYHLNGVYEGYKVTFNQSPEGFYEAYSNGHLGGAVYFGSLEEVENFYNDWMDELNAKG